MSVFDPLDRTRLYRVSWGSSITQAVTLTENARIHDYYLQDESAMQHILVEGLKAGAVVAIVLYREGA